MLISPLTIFIVKSIGEIGFLMTAGPPMWAGLKNLKLLNFDKKTVPQTKLGATLKDRVSSFLKNSANEFRPWHFIAMAVGLFLTFLASLHDLWVAFSNF